MIKYINNKHILSFYNAYIKVFEFIYVHLAHKPMHRYIHNNIDHRVPCKQMRDNNDNNYDDNNNNISNATYNFPTEQEFPWC